MILMKSKRLLSVTLLLIINLSLFNAFINSTQVYAQQENTGSMLIKVDGLKTYEGKVIITVFDSGQNWLKKAVYSSVLPVVDKTSESMIKNVPYGEYAVSVIHDKNNNGDLDTGFMRRPTEPYGFSNNARSSFGPAKWKAAKFTMASPEVVISIIVK